MALYKNITDNRGQVATYHRIAAFAPVYVEGQEGVSVNLASYTSENYRASEKDGGESMQVSSTGIVLPLAVDDVYSRASIYAAIKQLPVWDDAKDC